jgi:hypothetical protein
MHRPSSGPAVDRAYKLGLGYSLLCFSQGDLEALGHFRRYEAMQIYWSKWCDHNNHAASLSAAIQHSQERDVLWSFKPM